MGNPGDISFEPMGDYLLVRITGTYSLDRVKHYTTDIVAACKKHNCNRVLVDMRMQAGDISISDQFEMGTHMSEIWPARTTLAIVDSPHRIPSDDFFEKVVANRGVPSKVFTNLEDAKGWLASRKG